MKTRTNPADMGYIREFIVCLFSIEIQKLQFILRYNFWILIINITKSNIQETADILPRVYIVQL